MSSRRAGKLPARLRRLQAPLWLAAFLGCAFACAAVAQQPQAVIAPGEAAVTGFSGASPPAEIAPGDDPAALTFIDPNGPSARIVDLRSMDGPARAQLVGAPKPFTFRASQVGQVFGVAIDDAAPPNLYVAATSVYGLPIVAPGPDGGLRRVRTGQPSAAYMNGLWGPQGGPGVDLQDRRRDRARHHVRRGDHRRPAQFGRGARRARLRSGLEIAIRFRSRERPHPSLWSKRRRPREL